MHAFLESLAAAYLLGIVSAYLIFRAATAVESRRHRRAHREWQRQHGAVTTTRHAA